jgi:hypothetical protein
MAWVAIRSASSSCSRTGCRTRPTFPDLSWVSSRTPKRIPPVPSSDLNQERVRPARVLPGGVRCKVDAETDVSFDTMTETRTAKVDLLDDSLFKIDVERQELVWAGTPLRGNARRVRVHEGHLESRWMGCPCAFASDIESGERCRRFADPELKSGSSRDRIVEKSCRSDCKTPGLDRQTSVVLYSRKG